jgi:hypothetical protein
VAKSPIIKAHGIDSVLKPFINDLLTLHNTGITIQYNGKVEKWKGSLLAFLADNLAAHELGGFKESFSFARRFCRSCLTDKADSEKHFQELNFHVRTAQSHVDQCNRLDGSDRMNVSVEYGINRRSCLQSLPHFSVVTGMPHDIMHDLFEGVIPHELKLLLQYCTSQSFFQLATLNHRLKAFSYGYTEIGDKPAPINSEDSFRQTASQMWLLAKVFPLLVGDLIPRDDSHWECFLKLLKICEICTAPALSEDSAAYVELLIVEHHSQFTRLYPSASIIPKMHFMVHYPQQIINFGPLIHTWTMRHEAKLRIIKRAARISNFKNVCQTVAKRHQHLLCYYIHSSRLLSQLIKTGPNKLTSINDFSVPVQLELTRQYQLSQESIVYTTSFVTCKGITFKPNSLVLLSFNVLDPFFCKISAIIKAEQDVILLCIKIIHYTMTVIIMLTVSKIKVVRIPLYT